MAYLLIEDLRGGVDRRRPIFASKPGTLWSCINAHITMGGDIEKRKAFVHQGQFGDKTFGLVAQGDRLYTFGNSPGQSVPSNVTYVLLNYAGAQMTGLIDWDLFDGKIYAIASFGDGSVQHFYDGELVTDWNDGIVRSITANLAGMATSLAALINASASYTATAAGEVITVTAQVAGTPFTVQTFAANGGTVDDQTMTNAAVTPNTAGVTGVAASFGFPVRGGPGAGSLTALTVGGVDVLGGAVAWGTDNTTFAALIASTITAFASSPKYNATAVGEGVVVTAALTGTAANGLSVVATTTGTATVDGQTTAGGPTIIGTMAGGVAAVTAVAQVNTLTLGGTFDLGDRFGVALTSGSLVPVTEYFGNIAKPWGNAACVKTHKRKMYAGAGSLLHFPKVNDPTAWNVDTDAGAGFLNAANHDGGSEAVLSLEAYQGRLALFSRHAIQLWTMQDDDALNNPDQILRNTGTRAARSTQEFAGNDVFYLDDVGIRSLRARDASNNAYGSGVGGPINKVVRDWMRSGASDEEVVNARAVVEPEEARFWMAIGTRIFVYSYFPDTQVAAWSWYEPGFVVSDFAVATNRVWVRAGDDLYLYGGTGSDEYGDDYAVTVEFPFTTAKKPGTTKGFTGMHMASEGAWSCQWRIDPNELAYLYQMGTNDGVTFTKEAWSGAADATHIAPVMVHQGEGYASLSQLALFYAGEEESN